MGVGTSECGCREGSVGVETGWCGFVGTGGCGCGNGWVWVCVCRQVVVRVNVKTVGMCWCGERWMWV